MRRYVTHLSMCFALLGLWMPFSSPVWGIPLEQAILKPGMRVAIYCGSFDPFHKGHDAIAQEALKYADYVFPHAEQEFYHTKPWRTHYDMRQPMLDKTYKKSPKILTSSKRLIDVVRNLRNKQITLVYVLGTDNVKLLGKTFFPRFLPDAWIVHVRPGNENAEDLKNFQASSQGKPVTLIRTKSGNISSTAIRNRADGNKPENSPLVPKPVRAVIKKYNLYRTPDALKKSAQKRPAQG